MKIKQFTWNIVDSNSWLITEENHGLLIDAIDSEDLYETLEPLETVNIIITHAHFDHIYGLNRIKELKPGAVVYATKQCSLNIGNKYKNMSASANAFMAFYKGKIFSKIDKKTGFDERTHQNLFFYLFFLIFKFLAYFLPFFLILKFRTNHPLPDFSTCDFCPTVS